MATVPSEQQQQQQLKHDFTACLSKPDLDDVSLRLRQFVAAQNNVRPLCLVSSGGTAVDLEVHAVRCLENFSTGLRGAISVEEFLARGYAVVHLWRQGSAAPFARVIGQHVGLQQSNHGLDVNSLGKLFAVVGEDSEEDLVQTVLDQDTVPWTAQPKGHGSDDKEPTRTGSIALHRRLRQSTAVQKALQARSEALGEGRLLTVPFRLVEEYLAKLQLCCQALSLSHALAMVYLTAAVSDFYVPQAEKATHKIQSGSKDDGLVLQLTSVPKTLGHIRTTWAPQAFIVSFKLETDVDVLRQKAEQSIARYGCHMIVGNLLQTRHEQVSILAPTDFRTQSPMNANGWTMTEIKQSKSSSIDSLESAIIDFVVQSHFEFISWHYKDDGTSAKAIQLAQEELVEERKKQRRDVLWNKAKSIGLEVVGAVLTMWISYTINATLQRRRQ